MNASVRVLNQDNDLHSILMLGAKGQEDSISADVRFVCYLAGARHRRHLRRYRTRQLVCHLARIKRLGLSKAVTAYLSKTYHLLTLFTYQAALLEQFRFTFVSLGKTAP